MGRDVSLAILRPNAALEPDERVEDASMKRFVLSTLLALAIGSQADAQILRRYAPAYYPSSSVVTGYTPSYYSSYYTPAYYTPSTVVTAGYYAPAYYPPSTVVTSGYYTPSVWNYYYPSTYASGYVGRWHGLFGRRGFW